MPREVKGYIVRAYRMIGTSKFIVTEDEYRADDHELAKENYKTLKVVHGKTAGHLRTWDKCEMVLCYEELLEDFPD